MADELYLQGLRYAEEGRLDEAKIYFEKALALKSDDPILYLHLARVLKAKGLLNEAIEILLTLIKQHPQQAAAFNNLGTVYFAQAQYTKAIEAYKQAILLRSDYIDAYYNLGLALSRLTSWSAAMQAYQAVIELNPAHMGGRFQLACILMQVDRYQEAIAHFILIEHAHPMHVETLCNLAVCYLKIGKLIEAHLYYAKAVEMDPSDYQILFNLGVIASQQGHISQAITFYLRALSVKADFFEAHYNVGVAYLALKDTQAALLHFHEALRLQPQHATLPHLIQLLSGDKNIKIIPQEYVRSLFNSYADHYEAHLLQSLHYGVPEQLYQAVKVSCRRSLKAWDILDLGCGTGLCAEAFKSAAHTLIGVDVAHKMLEKAAQKNIYTELVEDDITTFLQKNKRHFDLILAGDVFGYIGDLSAIFSSMAEVLKQKGCVAFTAECDEQENYVIRPSGRFVYSKAYLDQLALQNDFDCLHYRVIVLRTQEGVPVRGHLYVLAHKA